jgi:hypothetical protein
MPDDQCRLCGRPVDDHDQHVRFTLPDPVLADPVFADPGGESIPEVWMSHPTPHESVLMRSAPAGAFMRALLPIRLVGGHTLTYGVWLGIHLDDLRKVRAVWWEPQYRDLRVTGRLANAIAPWGLLGAPVEAAVRDPDQTPYCDRSDDPDLQSVLHDEWPHDVVPAAAG